MRHIRWWRDWDAYTRYDKLPTRPGYRDRTGGLCWQQHHRPGPYGSTAPVSASTGGGPSLQSTGLCGFRHPSHVMPATVQRRRR